MPSVTLAVPDPARDDCALRVDTLPELERESWDWLTVVEDAILLLRPKMLLPVPIVVNDVVPKSKLLGLPVFASFPVFVTGVSALAAENAEIDGLEEDPELKIGILGNKTASVDEKGTLLEAADIDVAAAELVVLAGEARLLVPLRNEFERPVETGADVEENIKGLTAGGPLFELLLGTVEETLPKKVEFKATECEVPSFPFVITGSCKLFSIPFSDPIVLTEASVTVEVTPSELHQKDSIQICSRNIH